MKHQANYKNFDDVVLGKDYNYHFPIANPNDFVLPLTITKSIVMGLTYFILSIASAYILSQSILLNAFSQLNLSHFFPWLPLIFTLIIAIIQFRNLFLNNKLIIAKDKLTLPKEITSKQIVLSYAQIYAIYFIRLRPRQGWNFQNAYVNLINVHYLVNSKDFTSCEKIEINLGITEFDTQKITAIARTAMLNYHQKHHITDLPKVKFIQQK